jgi:hypothetical protein
MGTLLNELAKQKRRESAGASTAARFDYQKSWALCELIKKHSAGHDYLVAFEFHDDVLFLTPESDPSSVDFIQVKTSTTVEPRTLSSLTKLKNGSSIIGKMAANTSVAPKHFDVRLILISNNRFDFSPVSISASAIGDTYKKKLLEKLTAEIDTAAADVISKLHFHVSDIPVGGIDTFLKGRALELFEKRFGLNFTENVLSWLRLIQGEIARRNNYPDEKINSVSDLVDYKCLGKKFIDGTLDEVAAAHRKAPNLDHVKSMLLDEGWTTIQITRLDKKILTVAAEYNDPGNLECRNLAEKIREVIVTYDLDVVPLSEILDSLFEKLEVRAAVPAPYRDSAFVNALGVLIYHEEL